MLIAIPSRGRASGLRTGTLSRIPLGLMPQTIIFTHASEQSQYEAAVPEAMRNAGIRVVPLEYDNIAQKRLLIGKAVMDLGIEKFVMLDDDIDFLVRRGADDWRLREANGQEALEMFRAMDHHLDRYAQVAISPREGNNRFGVGTAEELVHECTRAMRITAYRTRDFLSVQHNRVPVMEDIDVTLQLLSSGRANAVLAYWANGQKMTNAPGGCSIWRTHELHNGAANRLAELHPGLVTTRQKTNKTDRDGFGTRTEVTVYWKKAFAKSQREGV